MTYARRLVLTSAIAIQCLVAVLAGMPARAGNGIPGFFFKEWTVSKNCTEQHGDLAAHVQRGLKLKISRDSQADDGSYVLDAEDVGQSKWAPNWNGMKIYYRPGTVMTSLPADFECIPGEEASSPFLAMSNYVQSAEPSYPFAHWYGIARIRGRLEHVLIFPRNGSAGGPSAVIVMQSASATGAVQLDENGVIHIQ